MYTNHYHLNEKPFNLTPDPNFLYLTNGHREALTSMLYGITERKGIISITGEVGTGKTTLIYALLNSLDKNVNTVYIYHTNITFEQILNKILIELNIISSQSDKTSLLQCFNDYLIEKLAKDEIIAIIIDEAQNLDDDVLEELRMLTNLETSKSKLLQLILVGQPELEKKLNSDFLRQLKQRISIRRQIVPLTYDQSEKYIKHRLKHAGSKSNIFTKKAISRVCEHSCGIPRNINIVCDNALLIGYAQSNNKINSHIINEVISDMDDSFLINPINHNHDNINSTEGYKTSSPINYYKIILSILLITSIPIILFINRNVLFNQNSQEPSRSKNIALSNQQNLSDTLTTDMPSKPNSAVSAHKETSANDSSSMELTAKNQLMATNNNNNNNISILDIREQQHNTITAKETDENLTSNNLNDNTITAKETDENLTSKNLNDNTHGKPLKSVQTTTVKNGSSLFAISREYYNAVNTTLAYIIIKANPNIKDIYDLKVNQEIIIPEITLETPLIKKSVDTYNIELGTFETIIKAEKYYKEPILLGNKIKIIPRKVSPKETWYQVMLEKFATKKDSLTTVKLLKEKGLLPCFNKINLSKASTQQMFKS